MIWSGGFALIGGNTKIAPRNCLVLQWSQRKWSQTTPRPNQKVPRKIGRNELCPCGSGKKYKRCCGNPARHAKNPNIERIRRPDQNENLPVYHECPRCNRPTPGDDFDLLCPRCLRELNYETKVAESNRFPEHTRQSTLFEASIPPKPHDKV